MSRKSLEHLCGAAVSGDDTKVEEIISQGDVDVNDSWNPDEDDYKYGNFHDEWHSHNRTPLHYAMQFNHPAVVSKLLASELTKLDVLDGEGWTPLHLACQKDNAECVKLFVNDSRCNQDIVNTKSKDGDTALLLAAKSGPLASVWELGQLAGTDFGAECADAEALMKLASEGGDIEAGIVEEEVKNKKTVAELEEIHRKAMADMKEKHDNEVEAMRQERDSKRQELKAVLNIE